MKGTMSEMELSVLLFTTISRSGACLNELMWSGLLAVPIPMILSVPFCGMG